MPFEVSLTHAFPDFKLQIDLSGAPGVTALFGPSGSGKTTTIRALAGLLKPDKGRIVVGSDVLCDTAKGVFVPPQLRRLGYVFQDGRLFPHLSVRDNLFFSSRAGSSGVETDKLIQLLGLETLLNRMPSTLSGGERQRVALGRALLSHPRMLLMDEPLAALDGPRKDEILPYLNRLKTHMNVPILYVTHSVEEMARLADHVVLLQDGQVLQHGDVFDVMSSPAAMPLLGVREAGAVLRARVAGRAEDGLTRLETAAGPLELPGVDAALGEVLRLRILAQDVILATERPNGLSARNVFEVQIASIEQGRGPGVAVVMNVGDEKLLARITARSCRDMGLEHGQTVYAILKATAVSRGAISA